MSEGHVNNPFAPGSVLKSIRTTEKTWAELKSLAALTRISVGEMLVDLIAHYRAVPATMWEWQNFLTASYDAGDYPADYLGGLMRTKDKHDQHMEWCTAEDERCEHDDWRESCEECNPEPEEIYEVPGHNHVRADDVD